MPGAMTRSPASTRRDRVRESPESLRFRDVAAGAEPEGAEHEVSFRVIGQHQNGVRPVRVVEIGQHLETVGVGELQVEDQQVGSSCTTGMDRGGSRLHVREHRDACFPTGDVDDASHDRMSCRHHRMDHVHAGEATAQADREVSVRPARHAVPTASTLECTPSLLRTFFTWVCTVAGLIPSSSASSEVVAPSASAPRISRSRSVNVARSDVLAATGPCLPQTIDERRKLRDGQDELSSDGASERRNQVRGLSFGRKHAAGSRRERELDRAVRRRVASRR